jgi:hypothetical protein
MRVAQAMLYAGRVRNLLLALFLAGCSSSPIPAGPPDLAAPVPDLSPPRCTLVFTGDHSSMLVCSHRFCRSVAVDDLQLWSGLNGGFLGDFAVDGGFTVGRTYAAGDLSRFNAQAARFDLVTNYAAGSQVAGSTVSLTFADIEPNNAVGCASGNVTAHGTVHVGMVEQLDDDAGVRSPGHVTLDATF